MTTQSLLYWVHTNSRGIELLRSKALKNLLATLLLLTVFAVLAQGVLHEAYHDSDHGCCDSNDTAIIAAGHSDDCHSEHHACSSLSCAHGTLFLAESAFCWNAFEAIELLKFPDDIFRLPVISTNLFRPPRSNIS